MVGGGKSASLLNSYDMTKQRKERNLTGTYIEFLDDHSKKLKKPFQEPPSDAAGLLNGSKWHGRQSPVKGKVPSKPEDGKEASSKPKSHLDLTWKPTDVLMQRPCTAPPAIAKPTKKLVQSSFASHLRGGGVLIKAEEQEPEVKRRSRGKGDSSPDVTVNRTRRHVVVEPGSSSGTERSSIAEQRQMGLRTYQQVGRPGTADSFLGHKYKPTSDLEPAKLETARPPNPARQPFDESASKEVYFNSFNDYCVNKSRSIYGGRFRFN